MTKLQIIFTIAFSITVWIDWLIKSNYLGSWILDKYLYLTKFSYITLLILFFSVSFFIVMVLGYFKVGFFSDIEVHVNNWSIELYLADVDAGEEIAKSLIPLFILNKFSKFPKWIKFLMTYIPIIVCYYYFKTNYSILSEYINTDYILFGYSLFLLYVLCFIFKLIIFIYLINHKEIFIETKPYKYLPLSFKETITSFRKINKESLQIITNLNLLNVKILSILLFIGTLFLIIYI